MKKLIILFCFVNSLLAHATSQLGDVLIWEGDTVTLFSNPLALREDWKELTQIIQHELTREERRFYHTLVLKSESTTMCNRGYVAEWKIVEDKIYLSNIYACLDQNIKLELNKIFRGAFSDNLLFADWVTDELIIPKGKCIEYVHSGYKSIYDTEVAIEFDKGLLVRSTTFKNHIARKSKFSSALNHTSELDFVYSNIKWDHLPDLKNKHIEAYVGIQPDMNGQIDSLIREHTYVIVYSADTAVLITDMNNPFVKEVQRIAKLVPDWDVVYQRGRIVSRGFSFIFSEDMRKKYSR